MSKDTSKYLPSQRYKELTITEDNWREVPSPLTQGTQIYIWVHDEWSNHEYRKPYPLLAGKNITAETLPLWLGVLIRWPVADNQQS